MIDDVIMYSELRSNLKSILDKVCDDSVALLVKRRSGKDVVLISKDDYDKMDETEYLNASPANRKHLLKAMKTPREKYIKVDLKQLKKELGIK